MKKTHKNFIASHCVASREVRLCLSSEFLQPASSGPIDNAELHALEAPHPFAFALTNTLWLEYRPAAAAAAEDDGKGATAAAAFVVAAAADDGGPEGGDDAAAEAASPSSSAAAAAAAGAGAGAGGRSKGKKDQRPSGGGVVSWVPKLPRDSDMCLDPVFTIRTMRETFHWRAVEFTIVPADILPKVKREKRKTRRKLSFFVVVSCTFFLVFAASS
jgi:hypothetical protein